MSLDFLKQLLDAVGKGWCVTALYAPVDARVRIVT